MEELVKPNTIYAGIGSDLREVLEKLRKEQGKSKLNGASVLNTWFVDPAISKEIHMDHIERIPLETFIRNKILLDHTFFNNATIISERMIEHIDVQTLSLILLPMLCNLAVYCNTTTILTFPDLDKIANKLNSLELSLFTHQLCNIEAIAFGDHKTVLTTERFTNMIEQYCIDVLLKFEDVEMDGKNLYTKVTITPEVNSQLKFSAEKDMKLNLIEPCKDLSEFSYKLNERLEEALMIKVTAGMYDSDKDRKLLDNFNYCFKYVNVDKLLRLCKNGYTKFQHKYVYDSSIVKEMMTKENRFEELDHTSIQLLNCIDPIYGWYSFRKVI